MSWPHIHLFYMGVSQCGKYGTRTHKIFHMCCPFSLCHASESSVSRLFSLITHRRVILIRPPKILCSHYTHWIADCHAWTNIQNFCHASDASVTREKQCIAHKISSKSAILSRLGVYEFSYGVKTCKGFLREIV